MNKSKKALFVLLTCLFCCSLSGCAVIDMFASLSQDYKDKAIQSELSNDSNYAMSKDTYKKQQALATAAEKESNQESGPNPFKAITSDNYCMPWNTAAQKANLSAKTDSAKTSYEYAKSTDSVYQKAVSEEQDQKSNEFNSSIKKFIPIIVIALVAVILLLLLLQLRKRGRRRPVPAPAPVVVQPDTQPIKEVERTGQLKVNYERQLRNNCNKLGLDYDKTLADYGGDARKAAESTMLMIK